MIQPGVQPPTLPEIFDQNFPEAAQRTMVEIVIQDYSRGSLEAETLFQEPERHDVTGTVRRGFIEQDLRDAMTRHGFAAAAIPNRRATSFHTRVTSGPVILTESCVESYNSMVREADFRLGYSASVQLHLLEELQVDEGTTVYAILVHAPHPKFPDQPGFVDMVFPSPDCTYYQDRIDLLRRFPDLKAGLRGMGREEIDNAETSGENA
jgi:hypothetical protein